jgi:hypothetical protein
MAAIRLRHYGERRSAKQSSVNNSQAVERFESFALAKQSDLQVFRRQSVVSLQNRF